MTSYERQLTAAIEHLGAINPMFKYDGADAATRYRQIKAWWGKPLADDQRHGHDTSGPITHFDRKLTLTDRQAVLLSYAQRAVRAAPAAGWAMTAEPAPGDALRLAAGGHGFTIEGCVKEGKATVTYADPVDSTGPQGADPAWPARMIHRTSHLEAPALDLLDALALGAAFSESPFAGQAHAIKRISGTTLDVHGFQVGLDWDAVAAIVEDDGRSILAAASGLAEADVQEALSAVLRRAAAHGHSLPAERPAPPAQQSAAGSGVSDARSVLEGLGINLPASTTVHGIGPGGSMSIGIGIGAGGGLEVSGLPAAVPPVDDEEATMAACAQALGITTEAFRAIIEEADDDGSAGK